MSLWLLLMLGCGVKAPPVAAPEAEPPVAETSPLLDDAVAGVDDETLKLVVAEHWLRTMAHSPSWATQLGYDEFASSVDDNSLEARDAHYAMTERWLADIDAMDPASLSPRDATTRVLFRQELQSALDKRVCEFATWSFSPRNNVLGQVNNMAELARVDDATSAAAFLARVRGMAEHIDTETENLGVGLTQDRVANQHSARLVVEMYERELGKPYDEWPMSKVAAEAVEGWSDEDREAFRVSLQAAMEEGVLPALERQRQFLADELLPKARGADAEGVGALPDGDACYAALVREYTTLDVTADELHQTGLAELESIHAEFRELGQKVFGTDDLQAIFEHLRTDEELFFATSEEVEAKAKASLDKAKAAMPDYFGTLPQADCDVVRIPEYEAPYTTIAYYMQPAADGSRPGAYYINTYAPETRPIHEAEVLAYHESIPGHHLQIAISQEQEALPAFRRHMGMTAFVEGWALYTERLSEEMGLYSGDVDRLGMLSFDAWRASRLVVDTGIHSKGWTREQAETFMAQNTPLAKNNITNEVDRYITTPGQALAYKTGQLYIRKLRAEAEAKLGDRFDIRGFHDAVLTGGAVSLPVLETQVHAWMSQVATADQ